MEITTKSSIFGASPGSILRITFLNIAKHSGNKDKKLILGVSPGSKLCRITFMNTAKHGGNNDKCSILSVSPDSNLRTTFLNIAKHVRITT